MAVDSASPMWFSVHSSEQLVHHAGVTLLNVRYTLRNRPLFRYLMEHPGRGTPYTVRDLAEVAACPASTVGHLRSGRQDAVDSDVAENLAEALGVAILVLFVPPTFTAGNTSFATEESIT